MRRRSLPQIVIPVPCQVDWNTMMHIDSDGRARFCDSCARPVYDSRSMTHSELYDLIARHEGPLPCLRLHRRPDGTIVTRDCFAPLLRAGRFLWLKVGLAAVAFWTGLGALRPWVRRPVPSTATGSPAVLDDGDARMDTRKVPFLLKPPEEPPYEEGLLVGRPVRVDGRDRRR
jgi:hypothetical protein